MGDRNNLTACQKLAPSTLQSLEVVTTHAKDTIEAWSRRTDFSLLQSLKVHYAITTTETLITCYQARQCAM